VFDGQELCSSGSAGRHQRGAELRLMPPPEIIPSHWEITKEVISGTIAGVILGWIEGSRKLLTNHLVQAFRERTKLSHAYRGALDFGHGASSEIVLVPKKRGYEVKGTLKFTLGDNKGNEYKIRGRFAHGLLTFVYHPVDDARSSQGSGTFRLINDNETLAGLFLYRPKEDDAIRSVACQLKATI